jgi:hypothetical protein
MPDGAASEKHQPHEAGALTPAPKKNMSSPANRPFERRAQDRAAAVAAAVARIVTDASPDWAEQVEALLRDEFHDVQQTTLNEIRTDCD